jgi:hypothetical protein
MEIISKDNSQQNKQIQDYIIKKSLVHNKEQDTIRHRINNSDDIDKSSGSDNSCNNLNMENKSSPDACPEKSIVTAKNISKHFSSGISEESSQKLVKLS